MKAVSWIWWTITTTCVFAATYFGIVEQRPIFRYALFGWIGFMALIMIVAWTINRIGDVLCELHIGPTWLHAIRWVLVTVTLWLYGYAFAAGLYVMVWLMHYGLYAEYRDNQLHKDSTPRLAR